MKKLSLFTLAAALASTSLAQGNFIPQPTLNEYGFATKEYRSLCIDNGYAPARTAAKAPTPYEILACKEGSVFGNEYSESTEWSGSASADAGRPDEYAMEFYQYFKDCYYTFNEVQFLGFFNYYNNDSWIYCHERGDMDADFNMTSPITITVGVFEEGDDGMPGKCVMKKDIDIIGVKTPVVLEGYGDAGSTNIYEFRADLGEDIRMEHGYILFTAKDMGDSPTCWFSLFTVGGELEGLQRFIHTDDYSSQLGAAFCLYGDGSPNAEKALKINRFITPTEQSGGKHEIVQVELNNIGATDITDAALELYVDNKLVATEKVNATISSFDSYKYTFRQRVDCSEGTHEIKVVNITPGDEKTSTPYLVKTVEAPTIGEYPICSGVVDGIVSITNVTFDEINNTSEGSLYSDFTDMKTTIKPLQTKTLNIDIVSDGYTPMVGVFIDWNGDHVFTNEDYIPLDKFETTTTSGKVTTNVSIPDGAVAGEHRMRIIAATEYDVIDPNDKVFYAEVEDYTVVVSPNDNDPVVGIDKDIVEQQVNGNTAVNSFNMLNNGNGSLSASMECRYILPGSPSNSKIYKVAPKTDAPIKIAVARNASASGKIAKAPAETNHVLGYSKQEIGCIGLGNYTTAIFANMFPGTMLESIKGMTISSVDVFVGELPEKTSIVVYGAKKQNKSGDLILEQEFTPTPQGWNHVELSTPVTINGTDLWVGVKMEGMTIDHYYIGVDKGPAIIGFGDIVNIGGDTWWSMYDLGLNYNYCINANVTGTPTPAINWLSLNNKEVEIAAGKSQQIDLTFNPAGLEDGLYEAYVEIFTNDILSPVVKTPVYMIKGDISAIENVTADKPGIIINGNTVIFKAEKEIENIGVTDLSGRVLSSENVNGLEAEISLDTLNGGIYIITAAYADGTMVSMKVPVMK